MDSSIISRWKRPVRFNERLLEEIQSLVTSFSKEAIREVVLAAKLDPNQIFDSASAQETRMSNMATVADDIIYAISRIEKFAWGATLADGTKISGMDASELLGLHNLGKQKIVQVDVKNNYPSCRIVIDLENRDSIAGCSATIKASLSLVQKYSRDSNVLFEKYTQPWWLLRNSSFLISVGSMATLALTWAVITSYPFKGNNFSPSSDTAMFGIAGLFLGLFISLASHRPWVWMFPAVEFQINGGIQESEKRRRIRTVLWSVPILSILIPYLVNHLR